MADEENEAAGGEAEGAGGNPIVELAKGMEAKGSRAVDNGIKLIDELTAEFSKQEDRLDQAQGRIKELERHARDREVDAKSLQQVDGDDPDPSKIAGIMRELRKYILMVDRHHDRLLEHVSRIRNNPRAGKK